MTETQLVSNRKAFHDYEIEENFETGIVLLGSEVKSLKNHGGSLQDAFVIYDHGELWLKNSSIAPYVTSSHFNHPERRDRKLLMHKKEIKKLSKILEKKGITLIPLSIYIKNRKIKVRIALAKGKKNYDKRKAIKEKEEKRSIARILKEQKED